MRSDDLRVMGVSGLMLTYSTILHLLRCHGIVRCLNNPVGGVTEWLVSTKLNLKLNPNSTKGFDAEDLNGARYQIKGRWLATSPSSKRFSELLNLNAKPFDYMVIVIFDEDFQVDFAAQIPISFILEHGKPVKSANSYRFSFTRKMLSAPSIIDLTKILREFPPSTDMERRVIAAHHELSQRHGSILNVSQLAL